MTPPKSLLVSLEFPPQHGGVGNYYYHVCKHLPAGSIVVLAPTSAQAPAFDVKQPFTIIREPRLNRLLTPSRLILVNWWRQWRVYRAIRQSIKVHRVTLLHVGHVLPLGTIALLLKRWRKLPYLLYAHGLDILLPQRSVRKKALLKRIIRQAHGLVSNSNFTREALLKLGGRADTIAVVYPCPNLTDTRVPVDRLEHLRRTHRLDGKRVILTVGRLVERKGHDQIIRALPAVRKRVPNATYLVVGNGPYRHRLQQLVNQYRLGEHVTFLDRVDETQLAACFEVCDVFAMPSRQIGPDVEGFGMVYLEAALFGKPAIAGESGGATEAVLHNLTGLIVNPNDTAAISAALIKLLTDRAYADRLGFQAMQRVLELFTWDRQVEKLLKLLDR